MIYPFTCDECGNHTEVDAKPFSPPCPPLCCGENMRRVYGCNIDTSNCRDHSDVPLHARVSENTAYGDTASQGAAKEAQYRKHIEQRRKDLKDGNKGSFRHTHSVPAELYHGKIKETGDQNYWSDPSNVKKHSACKVD